MRSREETSAPVPGAPLKDRILREAVVFGALLLAGLVLLPGLIYYVGQAVFGEYGGGGFAGFYVRLHEELRSGEAAVVFLLLSPCILWLVLRLTAWLVRRIGESAETS